MTITGYESPVTEADYRTIGGYRLDSVESQEREGWKARSDIAAWPIPDPIDWSADPFGDPNWYSQFHGWRPMDPYLQAYLRTRDGAYLRRIVPWAVRWPQYRREAPEERGKTLDALSGLRGTRLALVLDAHRQGDLELTDDERVVLVDLARRDVAYLMAPEGIQLMNHGYFQIMGLELLARVLDDEEWAPRARARAVEAFNHLISLQFTDEGVHVENSPVYHRYSLEQVHRSPALERMASPGTVGTIRRAEAVLPWLTFPDGQIADLGDSAGPGRPFTDAGERTVRLGEETYAVAPFWRSGYGIVRSLPDRPASEASMLLVVGTSHSHTHSHADKLSFELYELGRRLIVDTGKYGYRRDPMRDYVESAVAHNTVGLEDQPIRRTEVTLGATQLFEPVVEDDAIVLSGEVTWQTREYAFVHRRRLVYRPGEAVVITDALRSPEPRRYVSRLHFDRSLEVRRGGSALTVDLGGGRSMRVTTDCGEIALHRGETDPVRGWQSVGYLKVEPTTMAEVCCPGDDRQIEWRIEF